MRTIILLTALLFVVNAALAQTDTTQQVIPGRTNSPEQQKKPYVILISADGFRSDYATKYHADELLKRGSTGAVAEFMKPSFPSLTFPNHLSIITGLYPSHHGVVDNMFYDRKWNEVYDMNKKKTILETKWYGGTPLWVLAEKNKMLSASYYWVGSEAPIEGILPTYYYHFSEKVPFSRRIIAVKNWLTLPEDKRPHLITFYFSDVDHEGHYHGPDSPETEKSVAFINKSIGQLTAMTDSLKLPVNFIFVSDHGMALTDTVKTIPIPEIVKDTSLCRYTYASTILQIYCKDKTKLAHVYDELKKNAVQYDIHTIDDTPATWHYGRRDDTYGRIGDIILTARVPFYFRTSKGKQHPGKHGYDPSLPVMRATFMAWGPNIKKSGTIPPFENVNVYPLIAKILGLDYTQVIDGKKEVLAPIIK